MRTKVLVTGSTGQLGRCLQDVAKKTLNIQWIFKCSKDLDITFEKVLDQFFKENEIDFVINCAAYTLVDIAETDQDKAFTINSEAVKYLAQVCKQNNSTLIHISTDFVFDGEKKTPYLETDIPNPLNIYGSSKLKGEQHIKEILDNYFIIRTSWLYSKYGNNFVNTMLRLSSERKELSIVTDQIGTPTSANDLALVILKIIENNLNSFGIYNYSNEGETSWYDFAKAIFDLTNVNVVLQPILSVNYPTLAKRPYYSVLNKNKIKQNLQIQIPYWKDSLKKDLE